MSPNRKLPIRRKGNIRGELPVFQSQAATASRGNAFIVGADQEGGSILLVHFPHQLQHLVGGSSIEIAGNSGTATVYGERCLRDEGFSYRLPQYCARTARIYGQSDRIYSDQCLRDAGFRVGSARY